MCFRLMFSLSSCSIVRALFAAVIFGVKYQRYMYASLQVMELCTPSGSTHSLGRLFKAEQTVHYH